LNEPKKNLYDKPCQVCKRKVYAGRGYLARERGYWITYCKGHWPYKIKSKIKRELTSQGHVIVDRPTSQEKKLIRAFPGWEWDKDKKAPKVSLKIGDRRRVLELAKRLELEVSSELKKTELSKQAKSSEGIGLFDFQIIGVDFLSWRKRALLADDMGAGKTIQAIRALLPDDAAIVVTPACVKFNWEDEIHKWAKYLKVEVISGKGNFKWPEKGQVIVINYDILPSYLEPVKRHPRDPFWKVFLDNVPEKEKLIARNVRVIVDECHMVRNGRTFRARRVNGLVRMCKSVWGLSGTPLLNKPGDLWGMLCNLGMAWEAFGNFTNFKLLYKAWIDRWGGIRYNKPDEIVPELLRRVMLRRLRHEVLPDLPPKIHSELKVDRIPRDLKKALDEEFGKWGPMLLADEMPPFSAFSGIRKALALSRTPAMLEYVEICESQDCPLLVFSAHRHPILEVGKRDGWECILGDTPAKKRRNIVQRFQRGELKGMGLTIQAGGVGLTLTRAWKVLFVDLDWTPAMNSQAEDRVARIGQTADKVEIIRMYTDHPLDIHVLRLISTKMEIITASIEQEMKLINKSRTEGEETEEEYEERLKVIEKVKRNVEEDEKKWKKGISGAKLNRYREILRDKINKNKKLRYEYDAAILYENVRDAFLYMMSVCDGAATEDNKGFNRPDSHIARHIENYGIETEEGQEVAYYLLTRYASQLKAKFPNIFKRKRKKKD